MPEDVYYRRDTQSVVDFHFNVNNNDNDSYLRKWLLLISYQHEATRTKYDVSLIRIFQFLVRTV